MYQDKYWRELARKVGMEDHPLVKRVLWSSALPPESPWRKKVEKLLRAAAARVPEYHEFLPAPGKDKAENGWLDMGRVITGQGPAYPFRALSSLLTRHAAIVGPTGSGKSVLMFHIAVQAHRQGIAAHIVDTEDEYPRWVASGQVPGLDDFVVLSHEDLRLNVLFNAPPGVDPRVFITKSTGLLQECWYAGEGMINLIRDVCFELLQSGHAFSWREVYDRLIRMQFRLDSRTARYWESVKNRLLELLQYAGDVYGSVASHDLQTIFQRSVLWRLRGLSPDHLTFFINNLVLWLTLFKGVSYDRHTEFLLVFEEFTRICSTQRIRSARISEPLVLDLFRAGSKRGCALVAITQTPDLLPPPVASNIGTWIVTGPGDTHFLDAVANALVATPDQCDYLMRLNTGDRREAIVKYPGHPYPFLVEIPELLFPAGTPEQVRAREEWSLRELGPPVVPEDPKHDAEPAPPSEQSVAPAQHLSKQRLDYLVLCADDWAMAVTERDNKHKISSYKGNKLRGELERQGLIRLHRVPTGMKGKVFTLTEVTDKGYALLDQYQVSVRRPAGKGGFCHEFWQRVVFDWAVRQGYPAKIEEEIDGKAVDVGVTWEERRTGVEIVMGDKLDKELYNLEKDIERGWDRIVFCAVNQNTLDRLTRLIAEKLGTETLGCGRIHFMRLRTFLQ